mgnify:CR=1 FL=1
MILVIDNYDSFTYNLVQYLGEMGEDLTVVRNDEVDTGYVDELSPDKIVISPGPCTPQEAGISIETIQKFGGRIPILGVCLGHQSIGAAFGGDVVRASRPMHGKTSLIHHDDTGVFAGLENPFVATRYHSLIITPDSLPDCLERSAWTAEGEIMGVRHRKYDIEGVQFHPESVASEHGHALLKTFIERRG